MPMKSVIVLGATSMLGREIVRQLSVSGVNVISAGRHLDNEIVSDIGTIAAPEYRLDYRAEVLFHCASAFGGNDFKGMQDNLRVNVGGCAQALEIARKTGVKKIVYAGSVFSCPEFNCDPMGGYGVTKAEAERFLAWGMARLGGEFCSIRLTQLWDTQGECCRHQPWLGRIIAYASQGLPLRFPVAHGPRNFMHVSDAAKLLVLAAESPLQGTHPACHPVDVDLFQLATLAYEVFKCGGGVSIDPVKTPFRKLDFPRDDSIFSALKFLPAIRPELMPMLIHNAGTANNFGPLDVT